MPYAEPLPATPPSGVDGGAALQDWLREHRGHAALHYAEDFRMWHVFRHAEARQVLSDPASFSNDTLSAPAGEADAEQLAQIRAILQYDIGTMDPPRHRTMRGFVSQAFTPRMVAQLEPRITEITHELLDAAGTGNVDLVKGLTDPFPVTVITEMLGVPDRNLFHGLVEALFAGGGTEERMALSPEEQAAAIAHVQNTVAETHDYLVDLTRERRTSPAPGLINLLIESEVDGQRLTDDEIAGFARMLLVAGHVTTKLLLGNCLLFLSEHQDVQDGLRATPDGIPAAIEEIFRLRPPLVRMQRLAVADVELGGVRIAKHDPVSVWIASANRDELVFPDPDVYRPGRESNPHLGFGHGIHFCVGASLTRLETRVALRAVLDRCPSYRVDTVAFHDYSELVGPSRLNLF